MRKKITAAALLVAGGVMSLAVALSLQQIPEAQWHRGLMGLQNAPREQWFVLAPSGYEVPEAVTLTAPSADQDAAYAIGVCAAGECVVSNSDWPETFAYQYRAAPVVNGRRLLRFWGPGYFKEAWQALAQEDPALKMTDDWDLVKTRCLEALTAGECATALGGITDCWKRVDGQYCRNGLLYGPGLGGVDSSGNPVTCSPQGTDQPFPCSTELE